MHRVFLRRPLAYVSCIIFCAIVYRVPNSWRIIYMNSSDLANYTVSFTDLSRIMKNLRNAFIYTASAQQRNGNFQQWLPYNALCLGKATPSHCILETMRPRASASSGSHRLTGRSLPAFLTLLAVPWTPGGLPSHVGSTISQSSPWLLGKWDHVQGVPLGSIPLAPGCMKPHQPAGIILHFTGHYIWGLYAELGVRKQPSLPLALPRTDCRGLRCHQPSWIPSQGGSTGNLCACWAAALSVLPPRAQGICCPLC